MRHRCYNEGRPYCNKLQNDKDDEQTYVEADSEFRENCRKMQNFIDYGCTKNYLIKVLYNHVLFMD